jgi:hypothetical protein
VIGAELFAAFHDALVAAARAASVALAIGDEQGHATADRDVVVATLADMREARAAILAGLARAPRRR